MDCDPTLLFVENLWWCMWGALGMLVFVVTVYSMGGKK